MAYDREKIYSQALEVAGEKSAMFIDDVIAELPCSTSTFYEFFKAESEEMEAIKGKLAVNRVKAKRALRVKWFNNDNATTQMALYKLIATDEERRGLSMQYIQGEIEVDDVTHLTTEERNDRLTKIFADAANRGNIE